MSASCASTQRRTGYLNAPHIELRGREQGVVEGVTHYVP